MAKSINFTGQPVFSQLTKLLPKSKILSLAYNKGADRYVKSFTTWNHLVTMLFSAFTKCNGLRELESGMYGYSARLISTGLTHIAPKSTLSDANKRRSADVFEDIFKICYQHLHPLLPDSRNQNEGWLRKLLIIDSTTITLFKEIMKAAGRTPANGKRKGGVKVHIGMYAHEQVPSLVRITSSATNDVTFFKYLGSLTQGTTVVFDKAYVDYKLFNQWTTDRITWVSRLKQSICKNTVEELIVSDEDHEKGVISDHKVILGHSTQKEKVFCRHIVFFDQQNNRHIEFISNNLDLKPSTIAQVYKQRWQIELLFKRLKQNLQFNGFLGDNENAIKIQIWCNLLADLLITLIKSRNNRNMAYSVASGLLRIHLMNYVDVNKLMITPNNKNLFWEPSLNLQTEIRFKDPPLLL